MSSIGDWKGIGMRLLAVLLGLATMCTVGVVLGSATSSAGEQPSKCQSTSTTTTTSPASTTTTATTTSETATTTTATAPPPPTIPRPAGHPLNNNTVENCNTDTVRARSRLQLAAAHGAKGEPVNLAYAYAHDCRTGCQALAAAFQVALVEDGAQLQAPQNVALAVNYNCQQCGVFAYAYQYVVRVPRGTVLASDTRQQIATIRHQADAEVAAKLSFSQLDRRLRALAAQLRVRVDEGLREAHTPETHQHSNESVRKSGR